MSSGNDKIKNYAREILREILKELTEKQVAFFDRLYGSIDTIDDFKIPRAIQQVEATILKNNKEAAKNV